MPNLNSEEKPAGLGRFKIAFYGFLLVLLAVLYFLKPFLPTAIIYNFAGIDDYKIFSNRVVKATLPGQPWTMNPVKHAEPKGDTAAMLEDLQTTALLMIDNGAITYERYALDGGVDEVSGSFSVAKSILGLLTGFALQDGFIQSLDEPIENYFPNWRGLPHGQIKIRNLLTMTSGLDWNESYKNPFSITTEAYYGDSLFFTVLKQKVIHDPGTLFQYQSGTSQLLGFVLVKATNKTLSLYASEKLWGPLGAEKDALWSLDKEGGMEKAYCCFTARARDFARIGQLVLNKGKWNDKVLLNEAYINEMTRANSVMDVDQKPVDYYGYQWWVLKTPQGDVPYARGILGQYIIVLPMKNRVVVRLGMKRGKTVDHHPEEVRAIVDWALQ